MTIRHDDGDDIDDIDAKSAFPNSDRHIFAILRFSSPDAYTLPKGIHAAIDIRPRSAKRALCMNVRNSQAVYHKVKKSSILTHNARGMCKAQVLWRSTVRARQAIAGVLACLCNHQAFAKDAST